MDLQAAGETCKDHGRRSGGGADVSGYPSVRAAAQDLAETEGGGANVADALLSGH